MTMWCLLGNVAVIVMRCRIVGGLTKVAMYVISVIVSLGCQKVREMYRTQFISVNISYWPIATILLSDICLIVSASLFQIKLKFL